jgi:serine beta-lactamase-like protein LACTB
MPVSSILSLVFLLLVWTQAPRPSTFSAETAKQIDAIVEAERTKLKAPGMSVAVAQANKLVYAKGYGMADVELSVPAKAETVYRTASIAKAMTATAVMQLVEQGKLDLDVPVQKYCPAFPEKTWPVTTRHLLGHLGGIRHYKDGVEPNGTNHFYSIVDSLVLFKDDPLLFEPGTKFSYTTFGYSVLGCAIEGVSGMSYEDYMRQRVFEPAKMGDTGIDHSHRVISNRARGYTRLGTVAFLQIPEKERAKFKQGDLYNAPLHDTSMKIPGGGIVSTAPDLVRFAIAVNTAVLVNEKTRMAMWTPQKMKDGKLSEYGLGWAIGGSGDQLLVSHSGGQAGTSTLLTMMPSKGTIIAVMCNQQNTNPNDLVEKIAKVIAP